MALMKPWNKLTIPDLKQEIKKRNKAQKISNMNKAELKAILFEQISLSEPQIDNLKKYEIVNELKRWHKYAGKSAWSRADLADYLKHIYSGVEVFDSVKEQERLSRRL